MNEKKANRLIDSKSPYLLQHAYNPVDWYEWGEEAFDRAKKENKPIFLSIGYSTCHWCHVMEHQSFENEEIAGLMNLTFVNIKVDREERPDIDSIYMEVCQMLTGSGGWPLTIIMTSDKKPFFAGTYFPPQSVPGRIGMIDLIGRINDIWKNKRDLAESSANDIVAKLSEVSNDSSGIQLNKSVIKAAANSLISGFDKKKGGFSPSPKFPIPHNITFLLRYGSLVKSKEVLNMAYKTLDEMRLGGVYDQIGFGFHRYSTDANWLLPHFEKMLYDQAGLIIAYSEAYQLSGNENYKNTVYEIVDYLKREMLSPEGGFYSAEDADSEGVEGKFYVWTMEEISNILGSEAERFASIFNMKEDGNYFDEAGEYNKDKNIPHLKDIKYLSNEEKEFIEECRIKLFNVREERIHPYKDDKILTDWNGFIIAALSFAGFVFDNNEFVQLAENAAGFVLEKMADEDNSLLHRFRQGNADIKGMLDDYAFMTYGLLQLYESTSDIKYLDWAVKLTDFTLQNFMDEKDGGFYQTSKDSELLFKRHKDIYDGAMPSGNSVMMHNLVKLHKITDEYKYLKAIEKSMTFFSGKIMHYPAGYTKYISSLFSIFKESSEIVIAGSKHDSNFNDIIDVLRRNFIPFLIVLFLDRDVGISKYSKWTENMKLESGKTTVYFCKNYACSQPTSDADELEKMLMDLK